MKWLLSICFLFTLSAQAEVSSAHIIEMIDQMVTNNVISKDEAEKTKVRMQNITPEHWKMVNSQATKFATRLPASTRASENIIEEVKDIDLDGAQFLQIQNDLKKIIKPQ